jgi:predicted RNA binding protein YcfA (HicA-like mRNA interferase family)
MASSLRLCSGAEAVRKFQRAGWTVARQRGSHVMMVKPDYEYTLSIPQHDELGLGLLRKLIRQAKLSIDAFNNL